MKTMKRNRIRQLVQWGYITQPQANEQWRQYLRLFKQTNNQEREELKWTKFIKCMFIMAQKWFGRNYGPYIRLKLELKKKKQNVKNQTHIL